MSQDSNDNARQPARFGALLGVGPGGVTVYSSHYPSADPAELPGPEAYRSHIDGVFMGYKWQCVELARRWLYVNHGYVFDDVAMAYDIFKLREARVVADDRRLPVRSFRNGARRPPQPGCLLIWSARGEFEVTGHVAVVTEVTPDCVRFIEQNVDNFIWPDGQTYSRELRATQGDDGSYWIETAFADAALLGWVIQTDDDAHAEDHVEADPGCFNLTLRDARHAPDPAGWLDPARPDEAAYMQMMGGARLTHDPARQRAYLRLSKTARAELKRATNELHVMFLHATGVVLRDDALLERFNIPAPLWPKLRQSWERRGNRMITGRFDFTVSERGVKVYEYNADSASCYMEAGKVQGRWAQAAGGLLGSDAGAPLFNRLVAAWRESGVEGTVHIMQDNDLEETYHALFMRSAIEAAGLPCKHITGTSGLAWDDAGRVVDPDGEPICWVWKTWAWESALDQIRAECDADALNPPFQRSPHDGPRDAPRLSDVLLRPDVTVFEPFWTLIPSNKAILAVLWALFPDHPHLLETQFDLTDTLRASGHASKPIAGRCGANISLVNRKDVLISETPGRFDHQDHVFQALFKLPKINGLNVQVCTFSVSGRYAGACTRVDPSPVITTHSDVLALRVVDDSVLMDNGGEETDPPTTSP